MIGLQDNSPACAHKATGLHRIECRRKRRVVALDVAEGQGTPIRSVRVHKRLSVNNAAAVIEAALRGHGLIYAPSYQVAEHIAAGRLVRLLPDFETSSTPAQIVFLADRARKGAARAFIEHMVPSLKRELLEIQTVVSAPARSRLMVSV